MSAAEGTQVPAWGTPDSVKPANEQPRRYTVVGFFDENGERWCEHVDAPSAREAEATAVAKLPPEGLPMACGVLYVGDDGRIVVGDTYAKYLDPADPRGR